MLNHKFHFASKSQLNSETNLYFCENLKVTKMQEKFIVSMYQGVVGE